MSRLRPPPEPAGAGRVGPRRVGAAALVAGVLAAAPLAGPVPAAEAAACSGTSGVTVVVDFGSLGGGVQVSCAPGDPASGLSALSGAGYGYSFVPRQPGLVCQINGKPNPCNGAPTNAYWSYWHATRGGSWSYSTVGAGSYNPPAGTVEGWAFGGGGRPGIAPPAAAAPPPPPAPKPPATSKPTAKPSAGAPAPPAGPGSTSRSGTSAPPAPGPRTTTAKPRPSTTPPGPPATSQATNPAAAGTPTPPADTAAPSPATEPVGSSSGLARSALGTAVVLALAAAGVFIARRRRSPPIV